MVVVALFPQLHQIPLLPAVYPIRTYTNMDTYVFSRRNSVGQHYLGPLLHKRITGRRHKFQSMLESSYIHTHPRCTFTIRPHMRSVRTCHPSVQRVGFDTARTARGTGLRIRNKKGNPADPLFMTSVSTMPPGARDYSLWTLEA